MSLGQLEQNWSVKEIQNTVTSVLGSAVFCFCG